ncbi:MAG: hypothetical protein RLZZ292_3155 [Bacteroidota bacterium]|jgi:Fic family protein
MILEPTPFIEKNAEITHLLSKLLSAHTDIFSMQDLTELDKNYLYWSDFKYKASYFLKKETATISEHTLWGVVKILRRQQYHSLRVSALLSLFNYAITKELQAKVYQFEVYFEKYGFQSNHLASFSLKKEIPKLLMERVSEEAIASSQLEGASTTTLKAKEMLLQDRKPKDRSERMIRNNYGTMQYLQSIKKEPMTPALLLEIHRQVTQDTLENKGDEGTLRSRPVFVMDNITGAIAHTPPDSAVLMPLIQDFCTFINLPFSEEHFIPPILKAITLHFLIGYIHPFIDGNGRTARAMFYWYLLSKGYDWVSYISISKIILKSPMQYAKAYLHTENDENDLTYFFNYQFKVLGEAAKQLDEHLEIMQKNNENAFELLKKNNINERQAQILAFLQTQPSKILSVKEIETMFGIAQQTARTDLETLVQKGFLNSKLVGKKILFYL